ncbi:uncharacterized protein LOC142351050 isoform X3 [Convolutriloba macropyga]|uniref:uncharacterized protein LOC142351050 isoform X3 n=1 Tax=Convolutriloba macropyga TaxID=536237 RepID=UPI003F51B178
MYFPVVIRKAMKSVPKHPVSPKPETDPNACSKHANSSLEYFCKRCEIFICKQCWKSEHKNSSDHDVVLLSMIQEEYQDIKTLVEVYKNPIQKCSKAVMKGERALSELMAETEDTVKRLDSISTESSARKILKESKEIYSVLDGHINYLQLIKEELMENINVHFDGADHALRMAVGQMGELTLLKKHDKPEDTPNSKVLHHTGLSMAVKRCYEIPLEGCKKAVIDSKGNVFCFGDYLEQLFLCRSSLENDQMIFKEAFPWTSRKDGTILTNICMASDMLIVMAKNAKSRQVHFEVLNKVTFQTERRFFIHDLGLQPRDESGCLYYITGFGSKFAVFTRRGAKIEAVYLFNGNIQIAKHKINISVGVLYHATYLLWEDYLLLKVNKNKLFIMKINNNSDPEKIIVNLDQIDEIFSFCFVPFDDALKGYLCVSNDRFPASNFRSEIFEVDLELLQDGQTLQPYDNSNNDLFEKKDIKFIATLNSSTVMCRDSYSQRLEKNDVRSGYAVMKIHRKDSEFEKVPKVDLPKYK